jgi:hypothetical protein
MQKAASGFSGIADKAATKLGDAAPFEYGKRAAGGDVFSIAARGVSEAQEADCHAMYEIDMEQCHLVGAMYKDPRTYALCKQRAFSNFQSCRGY